MPSPNQVIISSSGGTTQASQSPEEIYAHGDVKTRLEIISFVKWLTLVLVAGGVAAWVWNPDKAKDFWLIIGPIISGSVSGVIGFVTGERQSSRKRK
jgi:hypothetical protein